jgi:formyl-CoA transferase
MSSSLPLEGVRVLDLTHALAGPYCTMLLGDLGADVIKLESPSGDHARHWGPPFIDGESSYFLSVNRNKRSVVLDLKRAEARAVARRLALASDVVVENYRPGTVRGFGLGHEELRAAKPALIYASISGFGQEHPDLAGYDQIAQGTSGLMSITGAPDAIPTKIGVPVGDVAAGMFTTHAILARLLARERGGEGAYIDVALNDSLMALLTYQAGLYFATGESPRREGNYHATIAPYGTFRTGDGFVNITVGSDAQFRVLCETVGAPELAADARFVTNGDRQRHRAELNAALEERLAGATTEEWRRRLGAAGVPAGPIHDVGAAFGDPVAVARGVRVDVDHPVGRIGQVAAPWRVDGDPFTVRRRPPLLGEHTAEVLRAVAACTTQELEALQTG